MSSIVGALTGGGGSGMAFKPTAAPIQMPVSNEQASQAYTDVQAGLSQQGDFLQALKAQNGLGNQSSVFNQQQNIANGTGPNPAQAMLANSTGQNVANQAAMMAGQRGSNANVGMMARQAAQQGANTQQQVAGQGAALQANQSLGALNQMGSLATSQANQQANASNAYTQNANAAQQNILNGINNQNNAQVGMQSNMNNTSAGLAGNVATQQGGMMSGIMGGIGSIGNLMGGSGGGAASGAGDAAGAVGDAGELVLAKGGQVPSMPHHYDDGGMVTTQLQDPMSQPANPEGPQSNAGKAFSGSQNFDPMSQTAIPEGKKIVPKQQGQDAEGELGAGLNAGHNLIAGDNVKEKDHSDGSKAGIQFDWGDAGKGAAKGAQWGSSFGPWGTVIGGAIGALGGGASYQAEGGRVPAMVSPGEKYLTPDKAAKVASGKADAMKTGKTIPGTPKVGGAKNDYANDTVPATLEEGGIVIPRSVTQGKNAEKNAMAFVKAHYKSKGRK